MLPAPTPALAVEHGIFSVGQALAAGHSRAEMMRNLRSERWRLVDRGVLVSADREPGEFDELLLAMLVAGPAAVLCLRSAAQVLGWDLLERPKVPELAVPVLPERRKDSPIRPRLIRRALTEVDVEIIGLLRITTAARTAVDLAADRPFVEASVAVDSAYRLGSLDPDAYAAELRSRPRMRGRAAARRVLDLASPLSGSPRESEIRILIVLAGLEVPLEQFAVMDGELLLGFADFAWPRLRLILEIDGFTYHSSPESLRKDHDRQRAMEDAQWRVLRFTGDDVRDRPEEILASLRRAGVCEISSRNCR